MSPSVAWRRGAIPVTVAPASRRAQNPRNRILLRDGLEEKKRTRPTGGRTGGRPPAPAPEPAPPETASAVYESLATSNCACSARRPTATGGATATSGAHAGGSDLGDHESAAADDGDILARSTGGEMYELPPPRSAKPFTRGTVPRGALLLPVSALAAPPPLVRGDSVQKVDALKAEAVSLSGRRRRAARRARPPSDLEAARGEGARGAVRRSADPASAPPSPSA